MLKLKYETAVYWITKATGSEVFIGDLLMMEDGFYQFFPDTKRGGYWPSYILRAIADLVDDKNKDWQKQLEESMNE